MALNFYWGSSPSGYLLTFALLQLLHFSSGQFYSGDDSCSVFYSERNFASDRFTLNDGEQSIYLAEDYRLSNSGWNVTGSITVEDGCSLEVCSQMYFDGICRKLNPGSYPTSSSVNLTNIESVKCSCQKECKCSDIFMKKSSCARGYLQGNCSTCQTLYTEMQGEEPFFPEDFVGKVEAFRLRKGCSLTIYTEEALGGDDETFDREIVEDYKGEFRSYRCECDDSKFEQRVKPPRPATYPPLIDIPTKLDDIIQMLNGNYSDHPGLKSAFMSLKNRRSSRNAYILLLGSTGSGKSSAINLLFDNPNVTRSGGGSSTTTDILEFRIPIIADELGVRNSELRVIDTPGLGDTRGLLQDATFLATLDAYLANHEELKNRIPNVVLIFHKYHDNRFDGDGSAFVRMLRGLDTFREKITDENYSNVIFVLSHFCSEIKENQKRPDRRLGEFKSVIENYSLLPKPIIITVAENRAREQELPMVNGFFKLPNNEYYPRNLFEKLELVSTNGGDMMGLALFRSAFRDSDDFNVTSHPYMLQTGSQKIEYYLGILTNAYFSIDKTEMSQMLKQTWEDKVDANLKRKFPGSLAYLQKALSLRNLNTKNDVPKTTTGILRLLTAIKYDEGTRELLKQAVGIQAPLFPHNTITGFSYNVFKDTYLSTSPFLLGDVQGSDIGFMIPKVMSCKLSPETKQIVHIFDNRQEYVQHRIQSLGVDGTIANESFAGSIKPGHVIKEISLKRDSCSLTALQEFRLFDFVLNDKLKLSPGFEASVRALPPFDEYDFDNVQTWNEFFNDFGTHVVKSVHGGGSIEIRMESDKPYNEKLTQTLFDLIKFAEDMSFTTRVPTGNRGNGANPRNATNVNSILSNGIRHSLIFSGGSSAYHTDDLTKLSVEDASQLLSDWKKSLKFNPVLLTTEMQLVPISQITKQLGQNYSAQIDRATSLLFNSELKYSPKKVNEAAEAKAREHTAKLNEFKRLREQHDKQYQDTIVQLNRLKKKISEDQIKNDSDKSDLEKRMKFGEIYKSPLVSLYGEPNFGWFLVMYMDMEGCKNLPDFADNHVNSINTHNNCIRLYDRRYCNGDWLEVNRTSMYHYQLDLLDFDDKVSSLRAC